MTPDERKDYKKLTKEGQKFYDLYQGMHPEWSHAQLMTMTTVCGFYRPPTTKEILAECIRKADKFMEENFPGLYPTVKNIFSSIGDAIKQAAHVTWEFIVNLFSKF